MKDKKIILFGVLNLVQGAAVGAIPVFVVSREPLVNWILGVVAVAMLLAGPAIVVGGRIGRIVAASACLINMLTGTVFAALVVGSASYLYGIYGRHGSTVGAIAFVLAAFVLVLFWLIPAHELHFLRSGKTTK